MKARISTAAGQLWRIAAGTELRRNVLETYGTRILVIFVTFATAIVIARELGPTGRGLYAVAATLGAIGAQFGNFGLHASNIYFVAKDRTHLPALIGNTLAVVVLSCLVAALSGILFVYWPSLSPVRGTLLLLALAFVPISLAYLLVQGLLLGVNEVRAYNNIESLGKILALALISILVVFHGRSVELFLAATALSVMVTFLWALARLRRVSTEPPKVSWPVFRQSIGIGLRAYTIAFFGFLLLRIDLLMVKYMLGATEAGYYSISQVLAENTMMFPVVIGLLLFPKLSALKEREEKLQLANKAVLVTAALMLPAVVIAAFAAGPGTYFLGIETVMVQLLNSEGFPPIIVVAWIVDTLTNVALNFWAIPRYGITGASIVSSVCYFLMFVVVSAVVWKRNYKKQPAPACVPSFSTET
jgi:O-antigen/teichoic acid export membrane protein